jgi:hypothetical protein
VKATPRRLACRSRLRIPPLLRALLIGVSACTAAPPTRGGERVIDVAATDYAFLSPDTVAPGPAVLRFTNHGRVPHEMIIMKLRPGVSVRDLVAARQRGDLLRPSLDGGNAVLFAQPGAIGDGRLAVNLESGRDYALWCEFQDGKDKPKHAAMGMFRQIHVAGSPGGASADPPGRRVALDVGDYAFRVVDTLAAGDVDFLMRNSGKQRHEVAISRLKAGTTTAFFFAEYLKGSDVDSLYDDDGAILTAYGGDPNDFAVRIDLLAGRSYVLLCELSDTPEGPKHATMGMFKGIVVR